MGISGPLPEHILKRMDKEARKPMGKAGFTRSEITLIQARRLEKELHKDFEGFLRRNRMVYIHSRMDKRATIAKGIPDFIILHRRATIAIEFKIRGNKTSTEQEQFIDSLRKEMIPVFVCYSYEEARDHVIETLNLHNA